MRTFIAIKLSEEIKEALDRIESHLKYSGTDVKWVAKDNIHLTLKFLGEITEEKCVEVKTILDDIGRSSKPFEISLKDIGAFPDIDRPRVIWVGLDKGAKESIEIAGKIDEGLSKIGFAKESRPFAAHLTIGRVRSSKNVATLREKIAAKGQGARVMGQEVRSIILFQSKLTPNGPIYTNLHEARLVADV